MLQIKLMPSVINEIQSPEVNASNIQKPLTHSVALEPSSKIKKDTFKKALSTKPDSPIQQISRTEKPVTESRNNSPQTEASTGIPEAGATGPAKEVDIEFEIASGPQKTVLGRGRHHYVSVDGEYFGINISQKLATDGANEIEQWKLDISGRINLQGLSPVLFQMQGRIPELLFTIKNGRNPDNQPSSKIRTGRMPDGILDRQSLLYQFMMRPPTKAGGKLWLTDGDSHGQYSYYIAGSESMRIGNIGEYRTIKVIVSADEGTEVIELWLLPESHYLPAKVRYIDVNGTVTEQTVIAISFK